jgi:hypothetical protein
MITAWCWTKEQEISDQFWEHFKYNLLNFSPVFFFNVFLTQYAVWQLKKRIAIKNLENSYQDRQTSGKSRNLLFKFKDFQQFFAGALSQFIFFNVFYDSICYLTAKKNELPSKTWKKVILKFEDKIPSRSRLLFSKFLMAILFF